ncbi:MAG: hypothetical protein KDK97_18415 [Verrucomicrobiales bacterium]|nr:hypothetical protein [Verrucomicrobiales bacterium]
MNDGNVWGYLFAFLGVVGLAGGVHLMMETDKATEELAMVQSQLDGVERAIRGQQANLAQRKQAYEDRMRPDPLIAELDKVAIEQLEVEAAISALLAEDEDLRKQITNLQAQAMASAPGTEFNDLALSESKILHNAKLQKIENDILSITHSDGVAKVPIASAPMRIKNRLLVGIALEAPPRRKSLPEPSTKPGATASPNVSTQKYGRDRDTPEWNKYKADLAEYEKKLLNSRLRVQALENEAKTLQMQGSAALISNSMSGTTSPSRRYYARVTVDAYNQRIIEIRRKMDAAMLEVTRMEGLRPKAPDSDY